MSDLPAREFILLQQLMQRAEGLRHYVARKIPPTLDILPDDVLQEAWIAAFRGIAAMRIEDRTAMDQWLTSIVNRKLVDAMRKAHTKKRGGDYEQIRETSTTSSFSGVLGLLMSRERTPSQAVSKKEASRAIRVALRGLNRERRQAVRLRYIKGLGPKEIALRMGKTTPAVSTLLFNALRELRERLGHAAKFFTDARSQDGDAEDQAGAEGASETARAAS